MDSYSEVLWIVGALLLVLFIGACKNRVEAIVNFVLRGVLGMLLIYFANYYIALQVSGIGIGYGLVTFLVSGILGFPGVVMLYGINYYMIL